MAWKKENKIKYLVDAINEERWNGYGVAGMSVSLGLILSSVFAVPNAVYMISFFFALAVIVPTTILGAILAVNCHKRINALYKTFFPDMSKKEVNKLIKDYKKSKLVDLVAENREDNAIDTIINDENGFDEKVGLAEYNKMVETLRRKISSKKKVHTSEGSKEEIVKDVNNQDKGIDAN